MQKVFGLPLAFSSRLLLLLLLHHLRREKACMAVHVCMLLLMMVKLTILVVAVVGCRERGCNVVQQCLDLGRCTRQTVSLRLHQLDKRHEQSPWMGPVDDESLEQDTNDLLVHQVILALGEQLEQGSREVGRVARWESKLVGGCSEHQESGFRFRIGD